MEPRGSQRLADLAPSVPLAPLLRGQAVRAVCADPRGSRLAHCLRGQSDCVVCPACAVRLLAAV